MSGLTDRELDYLMPFGSGVDLHPKTILTIERIVAAREAALAERIPGVMRQTFHDEPTPGHSTDPDDCWQCSALWQAIAREIGGQS